MHSLQTYLDSWNPGSFDWSHANCGHFVVGWCRFETGRDGLADAPTMSSALHWFRWVERQGGIEKTLSERLQAQEIPPALAQQGDIILMEGNATGWTLGICAGRYTACLGEDGKVLFVEAPRLKAWRLQIK